MKVKDTTTFKLDRTTLNLFTPSDNNPNGGVEVNIKHGDYPHIRQVVSDLTEETANIYSHTAFAKICSKCGNCCKRKNILVRGSDVFKIAHRLSISVEEFKKKYLTELKTWNEYDGILKLKKGRCPFLKLNPSGKYICTIYDIRPLDCRQFIPMNPDLCVKQPGMLIDYLDELIIKNDTMEIHVVNPDPVDDEPEINTTIVKLIDEKIIAAINKVKDSVDMIDGGYIDLMEKALENSIRLIKVFSGNILEESKKPEFQDNMHQIRECVKEMSKMATASLGKHDLIDEMWETLRYLEKLASLKDPSIPLPCVLSQRPHDYLFMKEDEKVIGITLYPKIIALHLQQEDAVFPKFYTLPTDTKVLKKVRDILKRVVTLEGEENQKIVSESDPPCYFCGECCRRYAVEIKTRDIIRIADKFGMTEKQFRKKFLKPFRFSWNKYDGVLKKYKQDEKDPCCKLLEKRDDGFYYCTIHEFKPEVCAAYSAAHELCKETNNCDYWYNLINNILRVDIDPERLIIHSDYTRIHSPQGHLLDWREDVDLSESIEKLLKAIEKSKVI